MSAVGVHRLGDFHLLEGFVELVGAGQAQSQPEVGADFVRAEVDCPGKVFGGPGEKDGGLGLLVKFERKLARFVQDAGVERVDPHGVVQRFGSFHQFLVLYFDPRPMQ